MKLFIAICLLLEAARAADLVVNVTQGQLRGFEGISARDGTPYIGFLGVPYAKPPVGDLRFKAPEDHPGWNGIRNATTEGGMCFENVANSAHNEDCLYLNIWIPNVPSKTPRAVMLLVHGGAFYQGSSLPNSQCPDLFMDHDVIFVSINYRLGPLGYMSLQIPELPGNAGSKDQVFALKWVYDNVKYFGGDPNKITIFGNSAGGVSVSFIPLSKTATGLLAGSIHQSGEALLPWSYATPEQAVSRALRLAEKLGCTANNSTEAGRRAVFQCLLSIKAEDISYRQLEVATSEDYRRSTYYQFVPTAEPDLPGAFITKHPIDIIKSGDFIKLPAIMGSDLREGLLYRSDLGRLDPNGDAFGQNMTNFIPLDLIPSLNASEEKRIGQLIKDFYFDGQDVILYNRQKFFDIRTDTGFIIDLMRQSQLQAEQNVTIYNYLFIYDGPFSPMRASSSNNNIQGPGHSDEKNYLYYPKSGHTLYDSYPRNSTPHIVVDRMSKMWTNFAKYGNPTPEVDGTTITTEWKPFTLKQHNFLEIGWDLRLKQGLASSRMKFWNDIYESVQNNRPLPE